MTRAAIVIVVLAAAGAGVRLMVRRWPRWASYWRRTPTARPVEELPLDDDDPTRRLLARLIVRVNIADSVNRRLRVIVLALVGIVGVMLIGLVLVVSLVFDARHQADEREADRIERTAAFCAQDRDTRTRINKGNDAKRALERAQSVMQASELDAILQPLTAGPLPSDPAQRAAAETFRANYTAGRRAVLAALDEASVAIDAAQLPAADPPNCTTTTTTPAGSG